MLCPELNGKKISLGIKIFVNCNFLACYCILKIIQAEFVAGIKDKGLIKPNSTFISLLHSFCEFIHTIGYVCFFTSDKNIFLSRDDLCIFKNLRKSLENRAV